MTKTATSHPNSVADASQPRARGACGGAPSPPRRGAGRRRTPARSRVAVLKKRHANLEAPPLSFPPLLLHLACERVLLLLRAPPASPPLPPPGSSTPPPRTRPQLIPALLAHPTSELQQHVHFTPGVPVRPMLAKPTNGASRPPPRSALPPRRLISLRSLARSLADAFVPSRAPLS